MLLRDRDGDIEDSHPQEKGEPKQQAYRVAGREYIQWDRTYRTEERVSQCKPTCFRWSEPLSRVD